MMAPSQAKHTDSDSLNRVSLRLPARLFRSIDAARRRRAGRISRNTWIAEAIEEKLAREGAANDDKKGQR